MKLSIVTTTISFSIVIVSSSLLARVSATDTVLRIRKHPITKDEAAAACTSAEEWDREDCIFDVLAVNDLKMAEDCYRQGLEATLDRDQIDGDDDYDVDGLLADLYGDDASDTTTTTKNDDDTTGNPL